LPESDITANIYPDLSFNSRITTIGLAGKQLVADINEYVRLRDIDGISYYTWRSGIKHDAAGVMEFRRENGHFTNGRLEECHLEPTCLFPLLKSSDIANGRIKPDKYVLVTQRKTSDSTDEIRQTAPQTWAYLNAHAEELDRRRSIIYKKRARFSVFGIGGYAFSPWKVAISGLYKNCRFVVVGEHENKPILLDDTCYYLSCQSENEARFVCDLLNSDVCQRFLRALVFMDAKRPVTIDILNRIDLKKVSDHLNRTTEAKQYLSDAAGFENHKRLLVFEKESKYQIKRSKRRPPPG